MQAFGLYFVGHFELVHQGVEATGESLLLLVGQGDVHH
jgi:hypothetical protein